jgi:ketosteroid isomerase-like protein
MEDITRFVREHFAAKADCDRQVLSSHVADDLRWWAPQSATRNGLVERPIGRDRWLDIVTSDAMYARDDRQWIVHDVVTDGTAVAVRAELIATIAATGAAYRNDYIFFMRLAAGRIAEGWEQFDSSYAFEKLFGTAN